MSASTSTHKSLWGQLPEVAKVRAPVAVLHEQGEELKKATRGLLSCRIRQRAEGRDFRIDMAIVATSLDNYSFEILEAQHGAELYPVAIFPNEGPKIDCNDQQDFEAALAKILQSDSVRRVISGLLTQMTPDPILDPSG